MTGVGQLRFDDQVAVITGAGGGLGRAYAVELAARGARVVVNDLGVEVAGATSPAAAVVDEIISTGGVAIANANDVCDGAAIIEQAVSSFGRLDMVINNAGVAFGGPLADSDPAVWKRTISTTLDGSIAVTRAAWKHLVDSGNGRVLMTSSSASFGAPGSGAYSTSKSAMYGLTRSLAAEGARTGVRVNAIMPTAWSRLTALLPKGHVSDVLHSSFPPESVAAFVLWLCHADTRVTGETFAVGGTRAARVVLCEGTGSLVDEATPEAWAEVGEDVLNLDGLGPHLSMAKELQHKLEVMGLSGELGDTFRS